MKQSRPDQKMFGRQSGVTRRDLVKYGLMSGAAAVLGSRVLRPRRALGMLPHETACGVGGEPMPTSPFILNPFTDPLPVPRALAPVDPATLRTRDGVLLPPGSGVGQQCYYGGTHQVWPTSLGMPNPIVYNIKLQVATHRITSSLVQPIGANGQPVIPPGFLNANPRPLPASTIYGFNGTFPGPMINAEYGKPCLVRFENWLDIGNGYDRQDFGAPDWAFLTHLHNGHTAPESDGNPHYMQWNDGGYEPGSWCDNLYLNYPAGGDPREMQSFCWFHDHRMHHTGANVYKGMVGLFPIYDPFLDPGDETNKKGLQLPGVRTNNPDGSFDVEYDIPLALYDCSMDDGVTPHQDAHTPMTECGMTHPEWWGMSFYRHYPNHGYVGDIFTVNGVAYPVLHVKRRKYRLRFLGASIARIYELALMSSSSPPVPTPGVQGQWQIPNGLQCMKLTQIASEGGLLPKPIVRDSFQIWPAKRREFIVDFTKYMDGSPTSVGDEIYLTNVLVMSNGRKPDFVNYVSPGSNLGYKVPMMKIVIEDDPPQQDLSVIPSKLRDVPPLPKNRDLRNLPQRTFVLERSGTFGGETEWLINGLPFDPLNPLARPRKDSAELWTFVNGSGGWVHPMHIHQEEHRVVSRTASTNTHPDDAGKEDVVAMDPGESVTIYRKFRTFTGGYVAHCHNLAHEDHNMMFGWEIVP